MLINLLLINLSLINFHHQIEALPEIVRAAAHHCEVYVDGGFRTGTDILKAVAIGARGVFLGRPILYGLAYGVSD